MAFSYDDTMTISGSDWKQEDHFSLMHNTKIAEISRTSKNQLFFKVKVYPETNQQNVQCQSKIELSKVHIL